jgi:TRAP-type C4-dicarboxylate transport system substrate-binding protein
MSSTEAGVALSTKVIDGILTSLNTYYHTGIYKSAIYAFVSKANYSLLNAYCFSLSRWNKLPKDIQNILREEFTRVKHKWYVDYARNTDEKILNEVKSEGVEMMIPTRDQLKIWRKKMASTWHVLPEKTGPGGKEYLDIVERYCK